MYAINNILLTNFGITPGRAPGSNIAFEGFLDLPKRTGKAYHDWSEEDGVEPYVASTDRRNYTLTQSFFYGHVTGATRDEVIVRLEELYQYLSAQQSKFEFASPWATITGYVKEKIQVSWLGQAAVSIRLTIDGTEDVFTLTDPGHEEKETGLHHIDNIPFADFGAFVTSVNDNFNRPATKEAFFSTNEYGCQVTKPGYKEFELNLTFYANDFDALKQGIDNFYYYLTVPEGTRIMNVDGLERECFNIEGATVRNIKVMNGLAVATMSLRMALAYDGVPKEGRYLLDDDADPITSNAGKVIRIEAPEVNYILDDRGFEIRDNDFEPITYD